MFDEFGNPIPGYPPQGVDGYSQMGAYQQGLGYPLEMNPQQGMGMYPQSAGYGMVKYTRGQYLDGLRNYVMSLSGSYISSEEKIEDTPQLLRHACAKAKVSNLMMLRFEVPETGVAIPFYFCTACGKLFYYKDFM